MNGNGKIEGLLERIAEGLEATQEAMREELQQLRADMNRGFAQVHGRMDNMLVFLGGHHADHERRIQALEDEVFPDDE